MKKLDQLVKQSGDTAFAPKRASSRLKSKLLSKLMELEQAEGPLRLLSANRAEGDALCIFEHMIAALPSEDLQSRNPCAVCHARVLGERIENAPIYWPGCPYAQFCGH